MAAPFSEDHLLTPEGVDIALYDWGGSGPPALLHHANGFCAASLAPLARCLRDRYRVFAMDARGHGHSAKLANLACYQWERFAADWIAVASSLVDQLGAPLALAMGHSFGATTTLIGSAKRPDLVEELLLVEPVVPARPGEVRPPERAARLRKLIEGARRRRSTFSDFQEAREHFSSRALFSAWLPEAIDLYVRYGLRAGDDGLLLECSGAVESAIFCNCQDLDILEWVRRQTRPATWLWARGGDFPRALYEGALSAAGDPTLNRLFDIDGGHLVPMEAPERVAAHLRAR